MSENNHTAEEERALDAMLDEALGGSRPPDLSDEILAQFHSSASSSEASVRRARPRKSSRTNRSRRKQFVAVAVGIGSLAAVLAGVIALQPDHNITDRVSELIENAQREDGDEQETSSPDSEADGRVAKPVRKNKSKRKPPKGIPMVVQTPDANRRETGLASSDAPDSNLAGELEVVELALVSAQVDAEVQGYWKAVGIEPAAEATAEETAARLAKALGTKVSAGAVS